MSRVGVASVSLRADAPEEAAEQVGKTVALMAARYVEMTRRSGKDSNASVFLSLLLGWLFGYLGAELGRENALAVLELVKSKLEQEAQARPEVH